uniref:Uncharacterized protein n=1 Tax=Panagrolaimus sp. ES5 TaxID=591445 RepID=A0AC34F0S5_9BILA
MATQGFSFKSCDSTDSDTTSTLLDDSNLDYFTGKTDNANRISTNQHFSNFHEDQKQWKSDTEDETVEGKNQSKLSLHIASYENSVENSDSIEQNESLDKSLNEKTFCKSGFLFSSGGINVKNFEFPRGDENKPKAADIMAFKASQKLLNPNQSSNGTSTSSRTNNPPPASSAVTPAAASSISGSTPIPPSTSSLATSTPPTPTSKSISTSSPSTPTSSESASDSDDPM